MTDVVVTGRSLPALQAALDLAEVGLQVTVLSGIDGLGSDPGAALSRRHRELPGAALRDPEGELAAFLRRVAAPIDGAHGGGESDSSPRECSPGTPLLHDERQGWLPQSAPNLLGIPAVVLSAETTARLGGGASFRAYLDRVKPLLTVGKTRYLSELVRARIGGAALEKLVQPQVFERFGVDAAELEVAVAAPGLNETLTRAGALTAAVLAYADRNVARETRVLPAGGWDRMQRELLRKLELYGVTLIEDAAERLAFGEESISVELLGGEHLETRAIVCDQGEDPTVRTPFCELAPTLVATNARVYASIEIEPPEWLAAGSSSPDVAPIGVDASSDVSTSPSPTALTSTVAIGRFGAWGLRVERGGDGGLFAVLSSRALPLAEAEQLRERVSGAESPDLAEALRAAAVSPAPGAAWQFALAASPWAAIERREVAEAALLEWEREHPSLVAVGSSLHGDDLAAALRQAHASTVHLRRRLLGLESEGGE